MIDGIIALIISYIANSFIMSNTYINQIKEYLYANNHDTLQIDRMFSLIEFTIQLVLFIVVYFIIDLVKYFHNKNFSL